MSVYHLTTHSGLEPLVIRELSLHGLQGHLPDDGAQGYVVVETSDLIQLNSLRTIHHILSVYCRVKRTLPWTLESIGEIAAKIKFHEFTRNPAASMRVTAKRSDKTLPFTSEQVERFVAPLILENYSNPVNLNSPEYVVRIDVHAAHLVISLQLTRDALSHRPFKPFSPVTALKANIAHAMILLSDMPSGGVLLDPFMGSGTLLTECARHYPYSRLLGIDRSGEAFDGTSKNLEHMGILHDKVVLGDDSQEESKPSFAGINHVQLHQGNALEMSRFIPRQSVDALITDPPYGVRLSKNLKFFEFYLSLLGQARKVLKIHGVIVIILVKRFAFDDALKKIKGFEEIERFQVKLGGFTTHLVKLRYKGLQ